MQDAVAAVITNGEQVLVVLRAADVVDPGFWSPVTGRIEPGEEQATAVAREALEEVGLVVQPIRKVWESLSDDGRFRFHWWLATHESGQVVLDAREVTKARWLRHDEYSTLEPTFEGDRRFFASIFAELEEVVRMAEGDVIPGD